jgi:hypothetical protein
MMSIIYSILAGVFYSVSGYFKNNTAETFNVNKFIYTVGRALVYGILLFYAGISTANADMATDMIMNMLLVVGIDKIIMNFYTTIKTYLKK